MRLIDADKLKGEINKAFPSFYMRVEINTLVNLAPTIRTKQIKYYDEDESVWKVGSVIVDE